MEARTDILPLPEAGTRSESRPGLVGGGGRPAWRLGWLTPGRCRGILVALVLFGFVSHLRYLLHDCPLDLSGDEAQYWDWSRQLDLSYYSKGPLVACIVRLSCAVFGDTLFAVRLPAVLLAAGTSFLTYGLTLRLFRSDRLALGAVLLNHVVPMFVAGSLLMTIDPPFFFCWGLATWLLARVLFPTQGEERPAAEPQGSLSESHDLTQREPGGSAAGLSGHSEFPARSHYALWSGIGAAVGVGFLAKYAMFLWLVGVLLFLLIDRRGRRHLGTLGPWLAVGVAILFTLPVVVWNARHGWVSFHHVATQTGAGGTFSLGGVLSFLGGQVGVVGPALAVILACSVVYALGRRSKGDPNRRACVFLVCVGMTFFMLVLLDGLRVTPQVNWPAPAYFTLMVLSAYFLSTRLADRRRWKPWRPWFYGAAVFGLLLMPVAHDFSILYPLIPRINRQFEHPAGLMKPLAGWLNSLAKKSKSARTDEEGEGKIDPDRRVFQIDARQADPTAKLRGWAELGRRVSRELQGERPGAFVLCEDYMMTAEMAFYVEGQPKTYYAGSWFADPKMRKRFTQYDMWPDRTLEPGKTALAGRDAIYLGHGVNKGQDLPPDLLAAFESVERLPMQEIWIKGVLVREFRLWKCTGFKGLKRPDGATPY